MVVEKKEIFYYLIKKNENITPIRMQKYMYFAYALWFIKEEIEGVEYGAITELSNLEFEAWDYGPVEKELYNLYNQYKAGGVNIPKEKLEEKVLIYLDKIYNILSTFSDFELVALSHCDIAWRSKYNKREMFHHNKLEKEQIKKDYIENKKSKTIILGKKC